MASPPPATDWYVLDRGRARILHLDASGRATRTTIFQSLGTYGPNGAPADRPRNVYLADTGRQPILVFQPPERGAHDRLGCAPSSAN